VVSGIEPLAVEPNLKKHASVTLTSWNDAATEADIVVYLVAHREFKKLEVKGEVLDFCGVTQA